MKELIITICSGLFICTGIFFLTEGTDAHDLPYVAEQQYWASVKSTDIPILSWNSTSAGVSGNKKNNRQPAELPVFKMKNVGNALPAKESSLTNDFTADRVLLSDWSKSPYSASYNNHRQSTESSVSGQGIMPIAYAYSSSSSFRRNSSAGSGHFAGSINTLGGGTILSGGGGILPPAGDNDEDFAEILPPADGDDDDELIELPVGNGFWVLSVLLGLYACCKLYRGRKHKTLLMIYGRK